MKEKKIKDYYDAVCEKFPNIPRKDVEKILVHGMRAFYHTHLYGGDTLFQQGTFWMYCGKCFKDSLTFFRYWKLKVCSKLRYLSIIRKDKFDGYYYIGLTEERFHEYTDQLPKTKRGGRRKKFTFKNVMLYKLLNELVVANSYKYVFSVYLNADVGWTCYRSEFTSNQIKLIATIDENKKVKYLKNE